MTDPRSNPNPAPSTPVSEEQLLDWIDGRLSADDVAKLARQGGRADLPARIAQMQRHKAVLSALPDVAAPMDLHDRVLAALEREALVGLSTTGEPLSIAAQREDADNAGREGRGGWFFSAAPRWALAAGLLLAVSGVTYLGLQAVRGSGPWTMPGGPGGSGASGGLAGNAGAGANGPIAANEGVSPGGVLSGPIAMNESGGAGVDAQTLGGPGAPEVAGASGAGATGPTTLAGRSPLPLVGSTGATLTIDEALALAGEGRLLVRVQPRESQRVQRDLAQLDRINAEASLRPWRLTRDVPAAVVAAALPVVSPTREAPQFAAAELIRPLVGPGAAMTALLGPSEGSQSLVASYLADIPSTSEGLDLMRAVLRERLRAEVTFAPLPSAVAIPQRHEPGTVLWWTQPPARWHERVTVPVVVER